MSTKEQRARAAALRYYSQELASPKAAGEFNAFGADFDYLSQAERELANAREMASFISPDYVARVTTLATLNPTAQAGTLLGLAKAGFGPEAMTDPATVDLLRADTMEQAEKEMAAGPAPETTAGTWDWFGLPKFLTRNLLEGAYAPFQALEGGFRTAVGAIGEEGGPDWGKAALGIASITPGLGQIGESIYGDEQFADAWEQTNAGQSLIALGNDVNERGISALWSPNGVDQGDGWFTYGEDSEVIEAQRAQTYDAGRMMWKKDGKQESWTLGRGLTSLVVQDGESVAAKTVSGVIDAAATLFLDPTIVGGKALAVFKGARNVSKLREVVDGLAGARAEYAAARAAGEAADEAGAARLLDLEARIKTLSEEEAALKADLKTLSRKERKAAREMERERKKMLDNDEVLTAAQQAERDSLLDGHLSMVPDYLDSAHAARDAARDTFSEAQAAVERTQRWGRTQKPPAEWQEGMGALAERLGGPLVVDEMYGTAEETASTLGKYMGGVVTNDLPPRVRAAKGEELQWEDIGLPAVARDGEGLHSLPDGRKPRVVSHRSKINNSLRAKPAVVEEVPGEVTERVIREGRDQWPDPASPSYSDDVDAVTDELRALANDGNEEAARVRDALIGEREAAMETFLQNLDDSNPDLVVAYLQGDQKAISAVEDIFEQVKGGIIATLREEQALPSPESIGLGRQVEEIVGETTTRTVREAEDVKATFLENLVKATLGSGKNPSKRRQEIAQGFAVMLNDPRTTWGDLLNYAADFDVTRAFALAMERTGIDGISGVRAARGLPESPHGPGYWWTNIADTYVTDVPGSLGGFNAAAARAIATPTKRQAKEAYRAANRDLQTAIRYYKSEGARQTAKWKAVQRAERVGTLSRDRYFDAATIQRETADQIDALGLDVAERTEYLANLSTEAEMLRRNAGQYTNHNWSNRYDWEQVRGFLFGTRRGKATLQHMVDSTDTAHLYRITSGKLPHEAYGAIAAAKTESEVLAALTPYIGREITSDFRGWTALAGEGTALPAAVSVLSKGSRIWGMASSVVPKGVKIVYADPEGTTASLLNYARYIGMSVEEQDNLLRASLGANTEAAMRNVVIDSFKAMNKTLVDAVERQGGMTAGAREEMLKNINEGVILYARARVEQETYLAKMLGEDSAPVFQLVNGERVRLPNAELDAEFASGGLILPDPLELRRAATKAGRLIAGNPGSKAVRDAATYFLGTMWRTLALVMRPAFIIRNIGEEQVRMFLNGGPSIFTHPIGIIAMATSTGKNSKASRRLRESFDRYSAKQMDEYVTGKPMRITQEMENDVYGLADEYTEAISHMYSPLRPNEYRQGVAATAVRLVGVAERPAFRQGWAHELMLLRKSSLARMVNGDADSYPQIAELNATIGNWDEAVITFLHSTPEGMRYVDEIEQASPEMAQILRDPAAARDYLFGDSIRSVRGRSQHFAAGNPAIEDFYRTGRLIDDDGTVRFDMNQLWRDSAIKGTAVDQRWNFFAKQLDPLVDDIDPRVAETIRVRAQRDATANRSAAGTRFDTAVDWFFDISAKMERAASFGPEYRHTYWDYIGKHAELLTPEAKAHVLEVANRTVPKARVKYIPSWQTRLFKNLESERSGVLTVDDIQEMASKYAGSHIKSLFYNSTNEKAYWHSLRLIFPFGQAFANSLAKWTQLAARKPVHVYEFSKVYRALQEQGSNVLYELQNALLPGDDLEFDQSQGFLWADPNDEERSLRFWYPKMLTAPLGAFGIEDTPQFAARAESLNFIGGGGMVAPGVGPLGSIAFSMSGLSESDNALAGFIEKWSQPFGEPDYSSGPIETLLPSWFNKLVIQGLIPGSEQTRMATTKQAATYLASQVDQYNGALTPDDQDRMMRDADWLSRMTMVFTGIGAAVLPASPKSEWFIRNNQDGELQMIATVAGNYFLDAAAMGSDAAREELWNRYGVAGMYAITSINTPTSERMSDQALDWYKANKGDASAIGLDKFGVFFPGESSPAVLAWQEKKGIRQRMSPDMWANEVNALLFRLQKSNITRLAESQGLSTEEKAVLVASLEEEFGGSPESKFGIRTRESLLDSIRVGLTLDSILALPQGQEAAEAVALYDGALAAAKERNGDGLKAKANQDLASMLARQLAILDRMSAERAKADGGSTVSGVTDVIRTLIEEND